jgi:hypothetical protein
MTPLEQQLLDELLAYEDTVRRLPALNPKPSLLAIFEKLDGMTAQLPRGTSPDLLHFLHKKSYEKARMWLQDRRDEIARGGCDGRAGN